MDMNVNIEEYLEVCFTSYTKELYIFMWESGYLND